MRTPATPRLAAALAVVGAVAAFAWLAVLAANQRHFDWELDALSRVSGIERDSYEALMVGFSFLGAGVGLLLLLSAVLVVLLERRRLVDVAFLTSALLVAQIVNRLVKNAIDKRRPPIPDHELLTELSDARRIVLVVVAVVLLGLLATRRRRIAVLYAVTLAATYLVYEVAAPSAIGADNFSFPSGHATSSMAFAAGVVVLAWPTRLRLPALAAGAVFVAGVGLSRVSFAVHYPTDVLGGWLLSIAVVLALRPAVTAAAAWLAPRRRRLRAAAQAGTARPPT